MLLTRLFFHRWDPARVGLGSICNWSPVGGDETRSTQDHPASTAPGLAAGDRASHAPETPPFVRQNGIITGAQTPAWTPSRHRSFPARLGVDGRIIAALNRSYKNRSQGVDKRVPVGASWVTSSVWHST